MTIFLSSIFRVKDVGFEVVEGGGGLQWEIITAATTAVKSSGYLCDTAAGGFTITLPDGPAVGDQVGIKDHTENFATNNVTVNPNGFKIEGSTSNVVLSEDDFYTVLLYSGADAGWVYTDIRTHTGSSSFAGNGSEVTIAHGFYKIPENVAVVATTNPGGYLGELWVRKDATNIYVGNSGSHTGAFDWSATV